MAISIIPPVSGSGSGSSGAASNDFTINVGTSGYTRVPLSTSFPVGSYICLSSLSDSTLDIYLINEDGTSAGYANATTATTTVTATKSFDTVVVYGATNNDTLTFQFKYVFAPTSASSTDFLAVAPRIVSVSDSDLQNINDTTTITGFNFAEDVQVAFTGTGYSSTPAKNIVRASATSLLVTRPDNFPVSAAPFTITVTNPGIPQPISTSFYILSNSVTAGNAPVWVTSATLPSFVKTVAYSQAIQATDSDGGSSVVYSVVSGALPTGITFNTSTATFSGTPTVNSVNPYSYTIRATDSGGNFVDRAFSLSQAVADAPTLTGATDVGTSRAFNNGAVSVAFTAPSYTGTSSITSYTVTASTGQTQSGSSSPIVVTGIATEATPTFTVIATNTGGNSLSSTASSSVTVTTVPAAPTIGTASITNSTTVSIPFTAGATGGKAISSYVTTSSPSISLSTSGTSSPIAVTGSYVGGQAYTFSIAAVNANGTSASSSVSNSLTPLNLPTLSGGTLTSDATYYYRTFTGNGTLSVSGPAISADVLVVGAGSGGGGVNNYNSMPPECDSTLNRAWQGGGGGAGGLVYTTASLSGSNAVVIGAGAPGQTQGNQSTAFGLTAGPGMPSYSNSAGGNSGSPQVRAGAAASSSASGNMTCWESGTRYVGGATYSYPTTQNGVGGGGGGAGSNGSSTSGGSGIAYFGTTYAQGGNGGTTNSPRAANTGHGGHAYSGGEANGASGSGIVVVRYLKSAALG